MDRTGYDISGLAEHHFQREGYECSPNVLMLALHLCHITRNIRIGCRLQHRADVAPIGWRGLMHGRLADQRPGRLRRRARLSLPRGRELRGADPRPGRQPRALEEQVDIIFKSFNERAFAHQGKHYTIRRGALPGLRGPGAHPGAAPEDAARRVLAPVVSASQRALDFMAKHGIKGFIGGARRQGGPATSGPRLP